MKHLNIKFFMTFMVVGLFGAFVTAQTTYYVHPGVGNDSSSGTSPEQPWRTLNKVSTTNFNPGDIIRFRAGFTFPGTLIISSSGAPGNPITYDKYGPGDLPIIDGEGADLAVHILNKEYLEFKNFKITNFREGTITADDLFLGMLIESVDFGTVDHLHFDNITIFRVNSASIKSVSNTRFFGGAILYARGETVPSNFNDVLFENCTFEDLGRTGLSTRSEWWLRNPDSSFGEDLGDGRTDNWFPSTNVVIRDNVFQRIRGNGLIVRVTDDALVEGNFFDLCGDGISGNAAFNFNTDGTVFQFNEAQRTVYNQGDSDARGIDSDFRTKNTIIQYNYLHDNGLGGVVATGGNEVGSIPTRFNLNTVIRYNIIENNARQGMHFSGNLIGCEVYNNIFYADDRFDDVVIANFRRWGNVFPRDFNFTNNVFQFEGDNPSYNFQDGNGFGAMNVRFTNNIYFGPTADKLPIASNPESIPQVTSKDSNFSLQDPLFRGMVNGVMDYALFENSPAIGAGASVPQPSIDYYGNSIGNGPLNIGIYQGTPIAGGPTPPAPPAGPGVVYVSEDAQIRDGNFVNTNYGSATTVGVKKASANVTRRGLLKFNVGNRNISSATLRVFATSNSAETYQNFIYGVDDNWSEATVTFNNAPTVGSNAPLRGFSIESANGRWYDIDLTSYVQSQAQGDGIVSLLITDRNSSTHLTRITSKEGNSDFISHIIIESDDTLVPVREDAYTRAGSFSDTNFGTAATVDCKTSSPEFNRFGLLKFDSTQYDDNIVSATLNFFASTNTGNSFTQNIRAYGNNWFESNITENSRPAPGQVLASVTFDSQAGKWYSIDVTDWVQEQKDNGWSRVSFAIEDTNGSTFLSRITSKEGDPEMAAFLEVESNNASTNKSVKALSLVTNSEDVNQAFSIYPNPVQHDFNIEKTFTTSDNIEVSIYSITGKLITTSAEKVEAGLWSKNFNRSDLKLSRGIYTIKLTSEKSGQFSSKILVY